MNRRIALLGPPASGKGTQAQMLSEKFHWPTVSTGELLRRESAAGSEMGKEADRLTAQGLYFPDTIALAVVNQWIDGFGHEGFILDGFPRTLAQALQFDEDLARRGASLDHIFHLSLGDEEAALRMAGRMNCPECGASFSQRLDGLHEGSACPICDGILSKRADDHTAAIQTRLATHHEQTGPVLSAYRSAGRLIDIDASQDRDSVFGLLTQHIERSATP